MEEKLSLEELRILADRAGLKLSDTDLQRLLPAVTRSRAQAAQLRDLISENVEPAAVFGAEEREGK
jgi:hypothetical protein